MLSVFICEDDAAQRAKLERTITNYIMIEELEMKLVMSTGNPYDIVDFLSSNKPLTGVYFLDIDLQHDLNGIKLASYIREKDIDGKIIFITSHNELRVATFEYKVEALDYIVKDETEQLNVRIQEALALSNRHYKANTSQEKDRIKLNVGNQIRLFPLEDVMFIETSTVPHRLTLHLSNGTVDFYGKINQISELNVALFRTHKSYVVNCHNIESINKKERIITMKNQEQCLLATRQVKKLEERL